MFVGLKLQVPRANLRSIRVVFTRTFVLLSLCTATSSIAAPTFESLDKAMTADERVKSGIDSLTAQQREFLNSWLKARYGEPAQAEASESDTAIVRIPATSVTTEADAQAIETEVERRVAAKLAATEAGKDSPKSEIEFEARLVGDFKGWTGKTVFKLDNGQVWRQRSASTYRYKGADTRVRFEQNWMGGWEMEVLSTGKSVLVKKLR
ncbi:MAG: hypothetical protein P8H06_01560 [Luminiphilus sp.]|nr:hypothetical protein [Luminiphilus sp.]